MKKDYKTAVPKERLEDSKRIRAKIISKYGFVPQSLLPNMKDKKFDELFTRDIIAEEKRSYIEHNYNVRSGALSRFPTRIGVFAMQFWSSPGDRIWDPCIGRGQRVTIANRLGRHYIGTDVCKEFYDTVIDNLMKIGKRSLAGFEILRSDDDYHHFILNGHHAELLLHDARNAPIEKESVNLVVTSPPYWDIEFYDDSPDQLGTGKSYEEYLDGMRDISRTAFNALKPGGYCIYAINDFRKGGKFYLLHADLIQGMMDVGLQPHDIVIYRIADHPLGAVFASQLEERKVTAKAHEYLIVGKKPEVRT